MSELQIFLAFAMQRFDQLANYRIIYARETGPWRSWTQVLSKNNKISGEKYHKLAWNSDPLNAAPEWQAGRLRKRCYELMAACPLEGPVRHKLKEITLAALRRFELVQRGRLQAGHLLELPYEPEGIPSRLSSNKF